MLRWWGVISFSLFACRSDEGVKVLNGVPEITIVSHDGTVPVLEGEVTPFRAQVSDTNHEKELLEVAWFAGTDVLCDWRTPSSEGLASCEAALFSDANLIAEVRDPQGAADVHALQLQVVPTQAPTVEWIEPVSTGIHYSDILIPLSARVADAEDPPELLTASLHSSLLGELAVEFTIGSEGGLSGATTLVEGQHVLTISVFDGMGKSATDTVSIAVGPPNSPPTCGIVDPLDGLVFIVGEPIQLTGVVNDLDISADQLQVRWTSDKDGELGTSTASTSGDVIFTATNLSADAHTVTMTVTDELGESCSDIVFFSVGDYPSITWSTPAEQSVHAENDLISLSTIVADTEDRSEDLSVTWTSDVDAELGSILADSDGQAKINVAGLSVGPHAVTATVTDGDGLVATATRNFVVDGAPSAPVVGILPQPATTQDDLNAVVSGSVDPEGQTVSHTYVWHQNGILTGYLGSSIASSVTEKGDVWTVTVTPSDGLQQGLPASATQTVVNTHPSINSVSITPVSAGLGETAACAVNATDVDNEPLTATYAWFNQTTGQPLGSGDILLLDGGGVQPNDVVLCVVTVTDPDGGVASASGDLVVGNTAPVLSSVDISPSSPTVWDVVSCSGSVDDPDNQTHTFTAQWFVGNAPVGSGLDLDLSTVAISKGDTLGCELSVIDSIGGTGSGSASVIAVNAPPWDNGISISPDPPVLGTSLSCNFSVVDPDGDPIVMSYGWSDENGVVLSTSQILDVDQTSLTTGDSIFCDASAVDSEGAETSNSTSATIVNTPPGLSNLAISPTPHVGVLVGCTADIDDPDGQALTTTYSWVNETTGLSIGNSASTLLSSSQVARGDVIRCMITVVDPYGEMAQGTATALVENAPPQVFGLSISPANPTIVETIGCSATVVDTDGDTFTESIVWTDDTGVTVGTVADLDLSSLGVLTGDAFTCSYSATDSTGDTTTESVSTTVVNAPPVVSSVTLSPSQPYTDSDVTAVVVASDVEGQAISLSYAWQVNGITVTEPTNLISGIQFFDKNQTLSVTVTPSDGIELGLPVTESVVVANRPPEGLAVRFEPSAPRHRTSDLICEITTPAVDVDGDQVGYTVNWFKNGQPAQVLAQTTFRNGDTIAASNLDGGDVWRCEMVPEDGEDEGSHADVSVEVLPGFIDLAVGASYTCGLDAAGTVGCWGTGDALLAPHGTFVDIEGGVYHACAMDSSGQLVCWGTNSSGSTSPPPSSFSDFSMGNSMTCAIRQSDGQLDCWGNNTDGRSTPPAGSFDVVNGGLSSSCALRSSDGGAECWGENDHGKSTPPSTSFIDVSVGYNTVCGLTATGDVECWGRNHTNQFNAPVETWTSVTVGDTHVCGITDISSAVCWGDNSLGQGTPPVNEVFVQLQAAVFHTCGLTDDGRILCWGDNTAGQLSAP